MLLPPAGPLLPSNGVAPHTLTSPCETARGPPLSLSLSPSCSCSPLGWDSLSRSVPPPHSSSCTAQKEESMTTGVQRKRSFCTVAVRHLLSVVHFSSLPPDWPEIHPHCCSLLRALKNSLSLLLDYSPVNTRMHLTARLFGRKHAETSGRALTSSLCALICRSISSGLLNCLPPPLWLFFPAAQL